MTRAKVEFADFDIRFASADAVQHLRDHGVVIFAYNVGNGGGVAWGEQEGILTSPGAEATVREATIAAMNAGADGLHLDNVHEIEERHLEALMDAQVSAAKQLQREPALHLKNAGEKYVRILHRRSDLRPYVRVAVVEHLISYPRSPKALARMGIPVFGIEFAESRFGSPTAALDSVQSFVLANPWVAGIWSLPTEDNYERRSGVFVSTSAECTAAP